MWKICFHSRSISFHFIDELFDYLMSETEVVWYDRPTRDWCLCPLSHRQSLALLLPLVPTASPTLKWQFLRSRNLREILYHSRASGSHYLNTGDLSGWVTSHFNWLLGVWRMAVKGETGYESHRIKAVFKTNFHCACNPETYPVTFKDVYALRRLRRRIGNGGRIDGWLKFSEVHFESTRGQDGQSHASVSSTWFSIENRGASICHNDLLVCCRAEVIPMYPAN